MSLVVIGHPNCVGLFLLGHEEILCQFGGLGCFEDASSLQHGVHSLSVGDRLELLGQFVLICHALVVYVSVFAMAETESIKRYILPLGSSSSSFAVMVGFMMR